MRTALLSICTMSAFLSLRAGIELATPFADHMVLQRGRAVPVWGTATPGAGIRVEFAGHVLETTADATGGWKVAFPAMEASREGRTLLATESAKGSDPVAVTVGDILVGEVWMCAGQSNADCPIWGDDPHYREAQGAMILSMTRKPFVRLVKTLVAFGTVPKRDYRAVWRPMTPQALADARPKPSAMGYLVAPARATPLDIPLRLVDCSWGGTNIDAWTPRSGYADVPSLRDVAALPLLERADFDAARTNGVYRGKQIYGYFLQQPSALWNGMVAAYAPMAVRGLIWYQGCHNSGEPERYCDKMHALYNGWAKEFANPGLRLYFAQLAPWGHGIADIQRAQAKFAAEEPNAGMAVINDVGCNTDIHGSDKKTVAKRLALHALRRDYGFDWIMADSPTLRSWTVEGDAYRLMFDNVGGWYLYNADWSEETRFQIRGEDGNWVPARIRNLIRPSGKGRVNGRVDGAELVVFAEGVKKPDGLRYLYAKPWTGNLYSDAGLPLGAFEIK